MRLPLPLKIGALTLATTAFYTLVGQLVPQKEIYPPKEAALKKEMTPDEMVKAGREIMENKGICFTCHTIGKSGALRFPDLQGVGARAGTRVPGLSDVQYLAQSLYEPMAFIVPGFNPGMPVINKPPIGLTDEEILTVIAYLQSLGGKVTVTMSSKVWPLDAQAASPAAGAPAPAAAPAAGPGSPAASAAPAGERR
ncbi:MAG: c-type cytochrome [Betaproteobacteria bacterium]